MTIKELIESLESAMEDVGEDCEVRLAFQPNYPLEYSVGPVEVAWGEDEEADNDGTVVYIEEGYRDWETDRKSTRLNSSHSAKSRMPSSA